MKTIKLNFYSNTKDDTHCFQAGLKMVAKYFWPNEVYSWRKLDGITQKPKDMWTWPMAGVMWFAKRGLDVVVIEPFDYLEFAKQGSTYLIKKYGNMGEEQIKHSDITQARKLAKEYVTKIKLEKRSATLKDLSNLFDNGYVICCNLNSRILNREQGYVGHFVVIKGVGRSKVLVNDPGLPPRKDRLVDLDSFDAAWGFPDGSSQSIIAFKKK